MRFFVRFFPSVTNSSAKRAQRAEVKRVRRNSSDSENRGVLLVQVPFMEGCQQPDFCYSVNILLLFFQVVIIKVLL